MLTYTFSGLPDCCFYLISDFETNAVGWTCRINISFVIANKTDVFNSFYFLPSALLTAF